MSRGLTSQLTSLEAQAAGQAEELRELTAMKQVSSAGCVCGMGLKWSREW